MPFLCNVTLHPVSPIEYFAIWEVFIDGEVKRRENGSVYPILLLEQQRFASCSATAGQKMVNYSTTTQAIHNR